MKRLFIVLLSLLLLAGSAAAQTKDTQCGLILQN